MVARGEDGAHKKIEATPDSEKLSASGASRSYRLSTEFNRQSNFSRHVRALFLKRAMNFKRDKKAWYDMIPCIPKSFLGCVFVLTRALLKCSVSPHPSLRFPGAVRQFFQH